ncbi:MAG TPA: NAD-dependent epimerase/dehydratase family protein [Pseudomonadales bacterium]|nr:NAD-dependent epimerase/dehydratase family protein [Pseudomonadales bacterium]
MKKICAITGGNGYVGGCIKKFFAARDWEIFDLTRRPKPGARAFQFQLGDDLSPDLLSGVDALVHCAYDFSPLQWEDLVAVNVEGSRKILQAARAANVPKIIYISSISAFDGCRSLYGKAKLETEKIALANGALVVRPGLVYGGAAGGMFGKLAEKLKKSVIVPMVGSGSQVQYLVHNEDMSAFIEKFASGSVEIPPRILTAANEKPWPFKQLVIEIAGAQGKKPMFIPVPWRFVWLALKTAEACGIKLNFRSDNLISFIYQDPAPDFSDNARVGLTCRPFDIQSLKSGN